jgi:hypothetical protein
MTGKGWGGEGYTYLKDSVWSCQFKYCSGVWAWLLQGEKMYIIIFCTVSLLVLSSRHRNLIKEIWMEKEKERKGR